MRIAVVVDEPIWAAQSSFCADRKIVDAQSQVPVVWDGRSPEVDIEPEGSDVQPVFGSPPETQIGPAERWVVVDPTLENAISRSRRIELDVTLDAVPPVLIEYRVDRPRA